MKVKLPMMIQDRALGDGDPDRAIRLEWQDHDSWSGLVPFTASAGQFVEFKFIVKQDGAITWEGGSNRTYTVPTGGAGSYTGNWR